MSLFYNYLNLASGNPVLLDKVSFSLRRFSKQLHNFFRAQHTKLCSRRFEENEKVGEEEEEEEGVVTHSSVRWRAGGNWQYGRQ